MYFLTNDKKTSFHIAHRGSVSNLFLCDVVGTLLSRNIRARMLFSYPEKGPAKEISKTSINSRKRVGDFNEAFFGKFDAAPRKNKWTMPDLSKMRFSSRVDGTRISAEKTRKRKLFRSTCSTPAHGKVQEQKNKPLRICLRSSSCAPQSYRLTKREEAGNNSTSTGSR